MDGLAEVTSVPLIVMAVYWLINLYKSVFKSEKALNIIPLIAAGCGMALAVAAFFTAPALIPANNIIVALIVGGASGLAATGTNQIFKQIKKGNEQVTGTEAEKLENEQSADNTEHKDKETED